MNILRRVPLPACGVMLGTAALGSLLQGRSATAHAVCGLAALFLLVLLVLKLLCCPQLFREDMKNPVLAGVSGTFTMGLMILSTYLAPFTAHGALAVWLLAIALHAALIVYFTAAFLPHAGGRPMSASWFIVYVGAAAAAVTAPARTGAVHSIGAVTFWFGLVTMIPLMVVISVRYLQKQETPPPARPLICIYAAPVSLCLTAYINCFAAHSLPFVLGMYFTACFFYIFAFAMLIRTMRGPFFPSWAAYTFPFVVSAIASAKTMTAAAATGSPQAWIAPIAGVETAAAVVLVVYVYVRYMIRIFAPERAKREEERRQG